ncbi:hypothetical protein EYF80_040450 [Liparis tanakae]|uniref:Uncharacterized protein n=1 Tax=Liparis tanakae TaxID=230148 RepID=A0A4Z2G866_9TELE|nr:hypothetical protein EYF80_040450 [Liparis tanakae]
MILPTQSTCDSGRRRHVILSPAIRDENQNMGHILPHAQRLLEQFLQNVSLNSVAPTMGLHSRSTEVLVYDATLKLDT